MKSVSPPMAPDAHQPMPERTAALFVQLQTLSWDRVEELPESLQRALELCCNATAPGQANDPGRTDSQQVWVWLVHVVKVLPTLAVRVAVCWYRHLTSVDRANGTLSPNRALAAYTAGIVELQRSNVAAARRWLHIACCEDSRWGHRGAARTTLLTHLGEDPDSLRSLDDIVGSSPGIGGSLGFEAEYLVTRWYLKRDIRNSDLSLDSEHELDVGVLALFIEHINGPFGNAKAQGDALEELAAYLLSHIAGCFPVRNISTVDFQTDLVVRNLARASFPALDVLGRYFLVECKNWASPVGTSDAAYFANRIRYCRAHTGLLFAKSGITGEGANQVGDARFALHRSFSHDGVVVALITQADLELLVARRETLLQLLLRKHDEVRFGART
jgi:hypothetical protein